MKTFNNKRLKPRRKDLRNNSTFAEVILWLSLKHGQLDGRKFRRQESIGRYIADFYCPKEKLVVELDGQPHFTEEGKKYDAKRTKYLESLGLTVVRFENKEVLGNVRGVLNRIRQVWESKEEG